MASVVVAAAPDFDEVSDAQPLVFRDHRIGGATHPSRWTSILRRSGDRVSLRRIDEGDAYDPIAEMRAGRGAPSLHDLGRPDGWAVTRVETFVGTVRRDGALTRFSLASSRGNALELVCRPRRIAVHRAGAELVPTPRFDGECGDRGVWRPRAVQRVEVLTCVEKEIYLEEPDPGGLGLTFAPAPGIELHSVNDDCALQGSGYRHMPGTPGTMPSVPRPPPSPAPSPQRE